MPQRRCYHGVAFFGDRILIVGGKDGISSRSILRSVVMYDITTNECQALAPLPYPVHSMATVKWGDDNVMIMGGVDRNIQPLKKVIMYNIDTQESRELPNMKYKREGCVAAVVRDTVIVMGGQDETGYLQSVETFMFGNDSWTELPEMPEKRNLATAAVYYFCTVHIDSLRFLQINYTIFEARESTEIIVVFAKLCPNRHFPNLFTRNENCVFVIAFISGVDFKLLIRVH